MDRKIRIAAVSYLNSKPLVYGLEKVPFSEYCDIVFDYPSRVAAMLQHGEADLGLVPVAIIPQMKEHYITGNYCIGASGRVSSVGLFSEVPLNEITHVFLDYQSRTSAMLVQVLLKNYWKQEVIFVPAYEGYEKDIKGSTAGLIIGDRAFEQLHISPFYYDLASAWLDYSGLPFVFAAWIANKKLPQDFIEKFDNATSEGLHHLDEIVAANPYPHYDLKKYYSENIDYRLDDAKRKGLEVFLEEFSTVGSF